MPQPARAVSFVLLVFLVTGVTPINGGSEPVPEPCPSGCSCAGYLADCSGLKHGRIAERLPARITRLDLSHNKLRTFPALLLKLENQGYININYMVVNNRDERSQQLHPLLKERLMNITLYAQDLSQPDVWQAVNAEKDDILVYDRCGRLTYHLSLPYTNLSHPHVEEAIRLTYCDGICGECSIESSLQLEQCKKSTDENTPTEGEQHHHHEHHGHHGHGHEGHHPDDVERHRHHHHHHHHHHHGQQQVDVGQQILAQVDFVQAAVEPPIMKRP